MKLRRLILPAIGLIASVCAISGAASSSERPIVLSQQVLDKLDELPIPPIQMLGEADGVTSQIPTRGSSQPLDLSTLPTEPRSVAPAQTTGSSVPVVGGGFLPDTSTVLPAAPRVRLRRPTYQITPALPLDADSIPNPGPAGARRSNPTRSLTGPTAQHLPSLQAPIAPSIFPNNVPQSTIPSNGHQFIPPAQSSGLAHGSACPCGCQPKCITQTVIVPCYETRYVNSLQTRYRPETRQRRTKKYYTVYDDVPKVETYTVKVPEPRTRTYTVNVPQEYQEPKQRNFTTMVAKPAQREETVERVETFKVPIVTPYTVMVPEKQQYQETTYKTVKDRVPVQKKYVVNVPKTRTRKVTTYEKRPFTKKVRVPVVKMVEETRTRPKVFYRSEVVTQTIEEPEIYYYDDVEKQTVYRYRSVDKRRTIQETSVAYDQRVGQYLISRTDQKALRYNKEVDYKVTAPYTETTTETYYVNEPYVEDIVKTYPTKRQVERTVNKTYQAVSYTHLTLPTKRIV